MKILLRKISEENIFANASMAGLAADCILRGISGQHNLNAGNKFLSEMQM